VKQEPTAFGGRIDLLAIAPDGCSKWRHTVERLRTYFKATRDALAGGTVGAEADAAGRREVGDRALSG